MYSLCIIIIMYNIYVMSIPLSVATPVIIMYCAFIPALQVYGYYSMNVENYYDVNWYTILGGGGGWINNASLARLAVLSQRNHLT